MSAGAASLAHYRGYVDTVEPELSGWVAQVGRPGEPVALVVSIDRGHRLALSADRPRPDVAAAGQGGPSCGFRVALPSQFLDGAEHELDFLRPEGGSLGLPGTPLRAVLGPVPADLIPAAAADSDAVLDLLRRTDFESGLDPELVRPENAWAFNALAAPHQGFLYYARAGARLVGYARLERGRGPASGLGVVALTILAAFRRKGLGEALLRRVLRAAAEGRLEAVWLSVRPDNVAALQLYEKLGFRRDANPPPARWAVPDEPTLVWRPDYGILAGRQSQ
jgi:ribosomal protein S18 acetylase RimI-like enzyme